MSYSQNSEESVILKYFAFQPIGMFLDVGANDGVTFSNTFALSEKGWGGVMIEPSPTAFRNLKRNYYNKFGFKIHSRFYFYPYAIGTTNGKVKMWDSGTHLGKDDHGLLSTMSQADYDKWKGTTAFTPIDIMSFRWKTFRNRLTVKNFDFISIDAESMDVEILKQISLVDTKLLCIEWNSVEERRKEILDYTSVFEIKNVLYTSAENIIIAR